MRDESRRYRIAARLQTVRELIEKSTGVTAYDLAERLGVGFLAVKRSVWSLREAGVAIDEDRAPDGKTIVYRIRAQTRRPGVSMTLAQMIAFTIVRQELEILRGTGLGHDLDDLTRRMEMIIADPRYAQTLGLDGRIFHVRGPQPRYDTPSEGMDEILAGLFQNEALEIVTAKPDTGQRTFVIEPYTLLHHQRLLYIAGHSRTHGALRTFGYDTIKSVKRLAGTKFERPADYRPEQLVDGAFGLIAARPVRMCIRFDRSVARLVRRMTWHPTQSITEVEDGAIELRMQVGETIELRNWLMSFGANAEVIAPPSLRKAVQNEARRMVLRYRSPKLWGREVRGGR